MPGGFASPGILFLNSWNRVERDYMQRVAGRLRATGQFDRLVEPCAGSFVMSGIFSSNFDREELHASDVNPFTSIVGTYLAGGDLKALEFKFDGKDVPLTGEPQDDAAILLYTQVLARMEAKPNVLYWQEIVRDLRGRSKDHTELLKHYLGQLHSRLGGIDFEVDSPWNTMREFSEDPRALIVINPPSYRGAYEKFYDTKGVLSWAQPEYPLWDAAVDLPALVKESEDWKATLMCLQMAESGECPHPEPVYVHDKRRDANDYIWSNHPDVILASMGVQSRNRTKKDAEPLPNPMMPMNYEVKADSTVSVQKLSIKQSRYYKDLWIHRIDASGATTEFAVFVDGLIAGMAGFGELPLGDEEQSLSMLYCIGSPHNKLRMQRLTKTLALTRDALCVAMNPWFVFPAHQVKTKNWTKHPESKGQRGLMKLVDRKTHAQYGYELVYAAPIKDWTIEEAFADWWAKEQEYHNPKPAKPKTRRRRERV